MVLTIQKGRDGSAQDEDHIFESAGTSESSALSDAPASDAHEAASMRY
jgi:hypothetical protein